MAIIAVLAGGMIGCVCAFVGNVTLQLGWFATIALWWSSGSLITVLLLAAMIVPTVADTNQLANDRA